MKRLSLLAMAALLAGCTTSNVVDANLLVGYSFQVLAPPEPYASEGLALDRAGRVTYRWVSEAEARDVCNGSGACTYRQLGGSCRITISTHYDGAIREAMIAHELGHCAGWPANHPV